MSFEGRHEFEDTQKSPAVIISLCFSDGILGAAIYDQKHAIVRILHDVSETDDYRLINYLVEQIEPTTILTCKAHDLNYIRYLEHRCKSDEENKINPMSLQSTQSQPEIYKPGVMNEVVPDSQSTSAFNNNNNEDDDEDQEYDAFKEAFLYLMPTSSFNFEHAVSRIGNLFSSEALSKCEADIIVQFRIDTKAKQMVRAFGALLLYLYAARIGVEYEPLNVQTPISAIKTIVVDDMIEIDWATYRAMEIFCEGKKEVGWKKIIKEGFNGEASLYSLMNRCRSAMGKHTLMYWFNHPILNRETIRNRQKAISFFVQDCNMDVTAFIHRCLGKVQNTKMILKKMRGSLIKPLHWASLFESLKALYDIGRCLADKNIKFDVLQQYQEYFGNPITEVTALLAYMIDMQDSKIEGRLVAKKGVDPDLDELKKIYQNLPELLTVSAQQEAARLNANKCSVGYVPLVGYLLSLPLDFPASIWPDLRMVYTGEDSVQMKSKAMDILDEELGDIKMQIIDKETTIALRLQKSVLEKTEFILGACKGAAILDSIIAMAVTARHFGWNCPQMTDEPIIEAVDCVHPLSFILSQDTFVPNEVMSGIRHTKVKIFTGPNACGKSVYMKQVAILVFLAHIGSFVPAKRSIIGPVNKIITRIYTVDGVLDGMSTFATDLQQVALALRRADAFSLVVLDEFGKGALTEVGLSVLASSLNYWLSKDPKDCPHIFISSHFHSLAQHIMNTDLVSYLTFEVLKRGNRLDYKFRLVDGICSSSHAAYIALKEGLPLNVVERANEVYKALQSGVPLSNIPSHYEEEKQFKKLSEKMETFLEDFESWDIENNHEELLDIIETVLLDNSERLVTANPISCVVSNKSVEEINVIEQELIVQPHEEIEESIPSTESIENIYKLSNYENEDEEEIEEMKYSEQIHITGGDRLQITAEHAIEVPTITGSILKCRQRKTPHKNNLSVTFAETPICAFCFDSPRSDENEDIMRPVSPIKRFCDIFPDVNNASEKRPRLD